MRIDLRTVRNRFRIAICLVITTFGVLSRVPAQMVDGATANEASPVTVGDPVIPVDHLELLVKPLTREELVVEADGWRDLLKDNVQQIARQRIALMTQQELAEQVEASDDGENAKPEPAETTTQRTQELVQTLSEFQQKKDQLVQRLTVVVDELEKKGGDVESYRQYTAALLGVAFEVTDTAAFWTVVRGWLTSKQGGQRWLWNIVKFLVIVIASYFAANMIAQLVRHASSRIQDASQLLVNFLGKFVKQLVMVIGLIVALAALEINITPLLAAVGAAGFVVGFALQDTLSNFASGLLILAYRPFDVGDVIEAAGISGKVDSVSLFSTHVRSFDNKLMIVPNNDIWRGTITNATASDTRRVDMIFGIGYEDDIEKAKNLLEALVKQHELVLADPAPIIQLHELADSSVNFVCRPWTKTDDYWTVYWDITRAVKEEFDRLGISIPFPQRDVHVYQESASSDG